MGIYRANTHRLWAVFVTIYFLGAIGIDFYWLFTESGLIRWLAMLQGKILGNRWYPKITFLTLLLAELVPVILLKLIIERLTGTRLTGQMEAPPPESKPQ